MRIAAGVMLIVFGVLSVGAVIFIQPPTGSEQAWVALPLMGLIVAGGICALVKRGYWWAFSGAVGLLVVGTIFVAFYIAARYWGVAGPIPAVTRSVRLAAAGALYNLPGLLALVFLVKRKGEFQEAGAKRAEMEGDER